MYHKIHWTSRKISKQLGILESYVYRQRSQIPPFEREIDKTWEIIQPGTYWAGPREEFKLRSIFQVPTSWDPSLFVALYLPIGKSGDFSHPEATISIDGIRFAACDRHHQEIILPARYCDGKTHTLLLEGWTGIGGSTVGDPASKIRMDTCAVVQIDQSVRDLIALVRVAIGTADQLSDDNPIKHNLYTALNEAYKILDLRNPIGDEFYTSIPKAYALLRQGVKDSGVPLDVDITAVGHAHIDIAWLWTLSTTRMKAQNSFFNVLRLMEQFSEFNFVQSQPQLYDFIRQDNPEMFSLIQDRVSEDRWEPIGGMWVEADCNLSGGESLVRQLLLGRQFFREYFGEGVETRVLWLPDVFGYAWNLPQLIKEAGLEYFFTIKIGWSQYNRFPYDSFWWQGLDGTRVLTHFSTTKNPQSAHAATYNADVTPAQTLGTWLNFQQKDYGLPGVTPPLLMSFGYGDGGGGPTREMLENIREMGDFPGMPNIHPGKVGDFFKRLEADVGERLPVWNGELYLEYHRGTYTTQARNKRANRKCEFLLHDAEFLASTASLFDPDYSYPQAALRHAWELTCLNQFHDIIPGSSIDLVYEESLMQYAQVEESVKEIIDGALSTISKTIGESFLVVNPTSFSNQYPVFIPVDKFSSSSDMFKLGEYDLNNAMLNSERTVQEVEGGLLVDIGELAPYSVNGLSAELDPDSSIEGLIRASPGLLENKYLRVEFDDAGDIVRIFDKNNNKEILPPGEIANQIQAFEDKPLNWDAWDIEIYYEDKMWLSDPAQSMQVLESGPLRATLEVRRKILNSEYIQKISLYHNSPRLDFETRINWVERQTLLKTSFPVDVLSPDATFEIQWGNVERPTHRNTSWDWARFETAAQKWVDLSEAGYGVSLLNDCKYGHDIHENVLRLTLLRGTTAPDPTADLGEHNFTYSLLPHVGDWRKATVSEAYLLNDPLIVHSSYSEHPSDDAGLSIVSVKPSNAVIETVKQAEGAEGIIVRVYENHRLRGPVVISTAFELARASRCNILEEIQAEVPHTAYQIKLDLKPYEIVTLLLEPKSWN